MAVRDEVIGDMSIRVPSHPAAAGPRDHSGQLRATGRGAGKSRSTD